MSVEEETTGAEEGRKGGINLHTLILIGLFVGAAAGVTVNFLFMTDPESAAAGRVEWVLTYVTRPLGAVFLNMLFMVVMPLVFCSLSLGVSSLGQVGKLGRLAGKTFGYFLLTSALSAMIGLTLVNLFRPGAGFDPETQARLMEEFGAQADEKAQMTRVSVDMFVEIVSRNPLRDAVETKMLPIIFFSIVFGIALTRIRGEYAAATTKLLQGIGDAMVVIVGFAMKLAPFAVPALIFNATAVLGWQVVKQLAFFVALAFTGYLIHLFVSYSILLRIFARYPPSRFFQKVVPVMVTAFSTSSSNATLPTSIKHSEEDLGVPSHVAGFVLPLGATANMNGTALFEGVVVLFVAQVFGVELSLGAQALVVLLSVLTAVGAAGVPSGSIPLLVGVLEAVGLPGGGIALIIGVDRLLDMGRTVVNVTGDVTAACFITTSEGYQLKE
jgi:DAACS family dicarboxylate/amino acid:cation (Na+ or H+) symporter